MGGGPRYPYLAALLVEEFDAVPTRIRPEITLAELGLDSSDVDRLFLILQDSWQIYIADVHASPRLNLIDLIAIADVSSAPPTA